MIERIGQRMADFVGTNGVKVVRAVEELMPGHPPPRRRFASPGRALLAAGAVAAGIASAVAREVISSNSSRSNSSRSNGSRSNSSRSNSSRSNGSRASTRGSPRSRSSASTTAKRAKTATADLGEKTRDELYKLASDASIRGRSSMSKDELVEALTRSRRS